MAAIRQARAQRHAASEGGTGSRGSSHSHEPRPYGATILAEASSRSLLHLEEFKGTSWPGSYHRHDGMLKGFDC